MVSLLGVSGAVSALSSEQLGVTQGLPSGTPVRLLPNGNLPLLSMPGPTHLSCRAVPGWLAPGAC